MSFLSYYHNYLKFLSLIHNFTHGKAACSPYDKHKMGGVQAIAYLTGEELKESVGDGKCFVALADGKMVGTASGVKREEYPMDGIPLDF